MPDSDGSWDHVEEAPSVDTKPNGTSSQMSVERDINEVECRRRDKML